MSDHELLEQLQSKRKLKLYLYLFSHNLINLLESSNAYLSSHINLRLNEVFCGDVPNLVSVTFIYLLVCNVKDLEVILIKVRKTLSTKKEILINSLLITEDKEPYHFYFLTAASCHRFSFYTHPPQPPPLKKWQLTFILGTKKWKAFVLPINNNKHWHTFSTFGTLS